MLYRVQRIRKERRDQSKRIDAKIKLQRMFRKKYSSNSLVLVETALPGGVMPADAPAEDSKEEELARKKAMRAVEDARRMEVHSAEAP